MQNDPAKVAATLRTLAVYAACAVLSIIIGVLMLNPLTYSALGFLGLLAAVLLIPVLMKWHRPLMLFSWYMPAMMFFIKGDPNLFLVMIALSITTTVVERAMGQKRFFKVPQITWPLFCLIGVIVMTAKFTGGLGLRAFGSEVYGGKKYVFLIVAILGYFAIASSPIPPERARRYVTLYFLGGVLFFIQDLFPLVPGFLHPIFWFIPPNGFTFGGLNIATSRLQGTSAAARYLIYALLACYGLRGIFLSGKFWRPVVFCIAFVLVFLGGYRSSVLEVLALIFIMFLLEGLYRTRLLPVVVSCMLTAGLAMIPLASKLPFSIQRSVAFLPPSVVDLGSDVRNDATDSWEWRVDMWKSLLPQIPEHLLLGKGYAISVEDFNSEMGMGAAVNSADPAQQALALSSDYHNGPISVILPFGIWGAIGFVWFIVASLWVLYRNYRYSIPELQRLNGFLLGAFIVTTIMFWGGSFGAGFSAFTGLIGLSVAINRGVRRQPAEETRVRNIPFSIPLRARRGVAPSTPRLLPPNRFGSRN